MYIPKHFEQTDRALLLEFISAHSFGMLISAGDSEGPMITYLPFVVAETEKGVRLDGHMAKSNPHWQQLQNSERALAVFNGPHCYVSPSLYESKQAVPTWNYTTVHAYGKLRLIHEQESKLASQYTLIAHMEPGFASQFDALDPAFRDQLLGAIVTFQIDVERLEGKFKLSQNRPSADRQSVAAALDNGDEQAQQVAQWMRRIPR
jgi:transcriptional regulator